VAYAAGNAFGKIPHNFLVEIEQARDRAQAPRQTTLCICNLSSGLVNSVLRITMRSSDFSTSQKQYIFTIITHINGKGDVDFVLRAQNRHHKKPLYRSAEG
jgi:hypothetical protein